MDNLNTNRRGFFAAMAGLMGSSIFTLAAHEEPKKQAPVVFEKAKSQSTIHFDAGLCIHTITLSSEVAPIFDSAPSKDKFGIFMKRDPWGIVSNFGCPLYPSTKMVGGLVYHYDKMIVTKEMFGKELSIQDVYAEFEKHKKFNPFRDWKDCKLTLNVIQRLDTDLKVYYLSSDLLTLSTDFSN